ncbi:MAG TPA: hypothetical protein VF808_08055 [Ktedonobacterales bacterium]
MLGFAALMAVSGCVLYVALMVDANRPDLSADLPSFLTEALYLIAPVFVAAAVAWWAVTRRAPRSGARSGAVRGGGAALLTAIFLITAVVVTLEAFALLGPHPGYKGPAVIGPVMLAWYVGWFYIPISTAVIGAAYGAMVHRAIGSNTTPRASWRDGSSLAP